MTRRRAIVLAGVALAFLVTAGVWRWRAEDRALNAEEAEAIVADYLAAIEREDHRTAAGFLNQRDPAPLAVDDPSVDSIAAALAAHCRDGCLAATAVTADTDHDNTGTGRRYVVVVTFGEPRGHPLQRSFVVEDDGGRPYVRGLPPAGTGALPQTPRYASRIWALSSRAEPESDITIRPACRT